MMNNIANLGQKLNIEVIPSCLYFKSPKYGIIVFMKNCIKCFDQHPLDMFYTERSNICKKCYSLIAKQYYKKHKDVILPRMKQNYQENKEYVLERQKKYAKQNRELINQYSVGYKRRRKQSDVNFRIRENLRDRVRKALKRNQKAVSLTKAMGCTVAFLRQHLESKFQPMMTWENYGLWHIDHIIPLCKFDLTNREQFLQAVHYTNLQPLWAEDNLKKSNK